VAHWLLKEEPEHYSYADLERDGRTVWDGVTNNLALKNLRSMRPGDTAFFYHTGAEKAVVGVVEVVSAPYADPAETDPRLVVVDVRPLRRLKRPVTLAEIKEDPALADWDLVRNSRLSVVPVSQDQWRRVEAKSRQARSTLRTGRDVRPPDA
jgi:predicted RNA-binding protein with PUA-like domain